MKRLSGLRKTVQLSDSIHRQLSTYSLVAGTAGASMLALVQPAEAKIVYTPVHENAININLDLKNDGTPDFRICDSTNGFGCSSSSQVPPPGYSQALEVRPLNDSNGIRGSGIFVFALPAGKQVGSKEKFPQGDYLMAFSSCSGTCGHTGHWWNVTNRYLGFKFVIKGEIHYGWARLNVHWKTKKAILTGYAYETIAGKPIITGKTQDLETADLDSPNPLPGTPDPETTRLGMLALGAPALSTWRREETAAATP